MRDHFVPVFVDGELVALVRMGTTEATRLSVSRMSGIAKTWPAARLGVSAPLSKVTLRHFEINEEMGPCLTSPSA